MGRRRIAAGTLLLMCAAAAGRNQPAAAEEGCDVLAKLVQSSVHAAAEQSARPGQGPPLAYRRLTDRTGMVGSPSVEGEICSTTAEVATRAFSRALAALDFSVTWNSAAHPGDVCRSGDLRRCYPAGDPTAPALPPERMAFVQNAWKAVVRALASQMPFGTRRGVAKFTAASLDSALTSNLSAVVEARHVPPVPTHGRGRRP